MILLDTNVVSALMGEGADPAVDRWLDAQPVDSLWTTTITVFEIRFGIERLTPSRRRDRLQRAFANAMDDLLGGRVIPFDQAAAVSAGRIAVERERIGRPIEIRDVQIAGIAAARKATLATGNVRHFAQLGFTVENPWSAT